MALYFRLKYGEKIKTFSPIIRPYRARVATYVLTIIIVPTSLLPTRLISVWNHVIDFYILTILF